MKLPLNFLGLLVVPLALAFVPQALAHAASPHDPSPGGASSGRIADGAEQGVPEGLAAGDWASIRAAYEDGRRAVVATKGGHRARNPGQRLTTIFDGRGFQAESESGSWSFGLELASYGWGEHQSIVDRPRSVSSVGDRVAYTWDDRLTEWFVNGRRGLEHGYTVNARPAEARGPFGLALAIRGGLIPLASANGRDVRFDDAGGAAALNYSGLEVFDADGRILAAAWKVMDGGLQLSVDDQGARYPLTIDPIVQQAYLKASNTDIGDRFGHSVAVSGDTVVVGAHWEDSNATGVNGNQSDNSSNASGAAYVFVRTGSTWTQQAYLKASNTSANDEFGSSVSISGDTIVVGAPLEDSSATGVDGIQGDNGAGDAGAAYVFVRSGVIWTQQAYLKASNTGSNDQFGWSVSVSGDTIVAGAHWEDSPATGVDGVQGDDVNAGNSGAAYVFARSGTTWSQQAYLKASNTGHGDEFGYSVAVSGDTIVVGATTEDSDATGIDGDGGNDNAVLSGAAYVFVRSGTTWSQQAYLKASNTETQDRFGVSVAVSGDNVLVGANGESSNATGVNGNQSDNSLQSAGAAYVFVRTGSTWAQQAYLKASNTGQSDSFGEDVSISGDTIVVGAYKEDSNATGVNGDQSNNSASDCGAAYLFIRNGTTWSQQAYLKGSNTNNLDWFGRSVAISGDLVVVGASNEDSFSTGVNGDQTQASNFQLDMGSAYVFDTDVLFAGICFPGTGGVISCPCGQPANPAGGCANFGATATTGAVLDASGTPSLSGDTLVLATTNHRTAPTAGILNLFFTGQGSVTNGTLSNAGVRCVNTSLKRLYSGNTTAGVLSKPGMGDASISARSAALGVAITAGQTRHYFNVYRDSSASGPCGVATANTNLTNGGSVTWAP